MVTGAGKVRELIDEICAEGERFVEKLKEAPRERYGDQQTAARSVSRGMPKRLSLVVITTLFAALVVPLRSRQPAAWKDPSFHVSRFIPVGQDVRLEPSRRTSRETAAREPLRVPLE
jgi:hypothetical protein